MANVMKKTVETVTITVNVTEQDIKNGECRLANRCMHKVALARELEKEMKGEVKHVKVDAGTMKFNLFDSRGNGYRWYGHTPKMAKHTLIEFDKKRPVKPHSYKVTFTKTAKINKYPRERQVQINAARRKRIAAGFPDKKQNRYTLRQRIVGYA